MRWFSVLLLLLALEAGFLPLKRFGIFRQLEPWRPKCFVRPFAKIGKIKRLFEYSRDLGERLKQLITITLTKSLDLKKPLLRLWRMVLNTERDEKRRRIVLS
jgi:hypothetical protein